MAGTMVGVAVVPVAVVEVGVAVGPGRVCCAPTPSIASINPHGPRSSRAGCRLVGLSFLSLLHSGCQLPGRHYPVTLLVIVLYIPISGSPVPTDLRVYRVAGRVEAPPRPAGLEERVARAVPRLGASRRPPVPERLDHHSLAHGRGRVVLALTSLCQGNVNETLRPI